MTKLIVFDKDHTLIEPISGGTFVQHPQDQQLRSGVAQKLEQLRSDGWSMAIASNQGGVAAGHKTLEEAIAEMKFAMELTGINHGYFCPDGVDSVGERLISCEISHPRGPWSFTWGDESLAGRQRQGLDFVGFRKPNPGMLMAAKYLLATSNIREEAIMVGDRPEDQAAAEAAGMVFEWADVYFGGWP